MDKLMHILEVVLTALALLGACVALLNAQEIIETCVDLLEASSHKLGKWWKRMTKKE